jgi:predicted TIM-barrel fold metal-dependent hydrolase
MSQAEELTQSPASGAHADLSGKIDYKIVDADAHVNPPHDFWTDYMPSQWHEMLPKLEHGEDADYIVFEGRRRKMNLLGGGGAQNEKNAKTEGRRSDMKAGGWMPAARIADMDLDGMDASVLFGGGPLGSSDPELYIESFMAYNRWLADFCAYDPRRLIGVGYIPMRDVQESIRMMTECKQLGFNAVNIPAFPQAREANKTSGDTGAIASMGAQAAALTGDPFGDRNFADPEFDDFWAAACDLDMTLTIHLGARIARFGDKKHFLPDMLMTKYSMAEPIAIMIFGGVFQRFPQLRYTTVESGVGWFAHAAEYMDRTWEKQRFWTECTIQDPPSFYMERNVYGSFINDRAGILMRDLPGAGNIMWSSDYPHSETTFPNSASVIARDFAGVPEDAKNDIICNRAKRLFKVGE